MAKVNAVMKTEVEISYPEMFRAVRKELGLEDYKIYEGKLMKPERSGWDGYDYVPVKSGFSEKKLDALKAILLLEDRLGVK